jgi:hypothetical protein
MSTVDLVFTTGVASSLQPPEGRPSLGRPGDGNAAPWSATESFFSLLKLCGAGPVAPAEQATPLPATPGAAMPFFTMPTAETVVDTLPDVAASGAMDSILSLLNPGGLAPTVPALAEQAAPPVATPAAAMPTGTTPTAEVVVGSLSDAADDAATGASTPGSTTIGSAMVGDAETPAPCTLTVWPPYVAGATTAAARPVKAPIYSAYRPWTMPAADSPPATAPVPSPGNQCDAGAKPTPLPTGTTAPVTIAPSPTVAAALPEVFESPAAPVPPEVSIGPLPSAPPEAVGLEAPPAPMVETPVPVVESAGGTSGDPGAQSRQAQQEGQAAPGAAVYSAASETAAAIGATSSQLATSSAAALSVLRGVGAAISGVAPTAPNSVDSVDPATGASVRAQLLAEIATQGAGATGHERIVLQLEPAHLGKVQVQLQANGSRLEIIVLAQNPEAEKALADGAQELVEAIVGRGEGRWQQVEVRFERSPGEREQRQQRGDARDGGEQRRGNQQGRRRDDRASR